MEKRNKTITIHQPNFFPWYPFFQKMEQADIFVILENCQFEKNNFQNRFNMDGKWYTMSTNKHLLPIIDKKYSNCYDDWSSIKRKLPEYSELLDSFDDLVEDSISDTNYNIIMKIREQLSIKTEVVRDYPTSLRSTERLVDICLRHGATKYISGLGGRNYLNIKKFSDADIEVVFQKEECMKKVPILKILKNDNYKQGK